MLLRGDGDTTVAIGQASHAWLSGQLARAWGNERFGEVVPREEVCLAAEQHDVGMSTWDLSPTLNPETGLPHSFTEMPLEEHLRLWRAAPERLLSQSRYAALLVSMHGAALYERRDLDRLPAEQAEAVRAFLRDQRAFHDRLVDRLGADPDEVARSQRLLFAWDALSLALCLRWDPYTAEDVPAAEGSVDVRLERLGDERFTLDPWPFAEPALTVRCEGRPLDGRFDDERTLRAALQSAPSLQLRFALFAPA